MVIVMFTMLIATTLLLRLRFKSENVILKCLRHPFPAGLIIFIITTSACLLAQDRYNLINDNPSRPYEELSACIAGIWVLSFISSSALLKTPVPELFITPFSSRLRIDIGPDYFHEHSGDIKKNAVIDKFVNDITLISYPRYKTITFRSHLLIPDLQKVINKRLKTRRIPHIIHVRKTPCHEVIILNLRYGGKTRYRLFSTKKHANGFRVHPEGGACKIRIRNLNISGD